MWIISWTPYTWGAVASRALEAVRSAGEGWVGVVGPWYLFSRPQSTLALKQHNLPFTEVWFARKPRMDSPTSTIRLREFGEHQAPPTSASSLALGKQLTCSPLSGFCEPGLGISGDPSLGRASCSSSTHEPTPWEAGWWLRQPTKAEKDAKLQNDLSKIAILACTGGDVEVYKNIVWCLLG